MILADHCVYISTVRLLRECGFPLVTLRELAPVDLPDDQVLQRAIDNNFLLLTNDKGFGNILLYPPATHRGIIVLKISAANETSVHAVLLAMLKAHPLASLQRHLCVVNAQKYRLRK